MWLLRMLVWLITRPLVIVAYIFRFIFLIFLAVGHVVTTIVGGFAVLGSIICMLMQEFTFWQGICGIAAGAVIYALPYIGAAVVGILDMFIGWVNRLSQF